MGADEANKADRPDEGDRNGGKQADDKYGVKAQAPDIDAHACSLVVPEPQGCQRPGVAHEER